MKKKRALILLMAAAMSFVPAATPVAWAATTPTAPLDPRPMAEQHNPSMGDITFHRAHQRSETTRVILDKPLPLNTTLTLSGANVTDTLGYAHGILFSINEGREYIWGEGTKTYTYLSVQQDTDYPYNDNGNKTTVRVLVQYPDGSQDIMESNITIIPTLAQVNAVNYRSTPTIPGEAATLSPILQTPRATGSKYAIVQSPQTESLRQDGWDITIDPTTGEVTAVAPDKWVAADVPVLVVYPDGTSQTIEASFRTDPYLEPSSPQPAKDRSFGSSSS